MSARRSTPNLDRLAKFMSEIGGTYALQVQGRSQITNVKMVALATNGRDFWQLTPALKASIKSYCKQALTDGIRRGDLRAVSLLDAAAKASKDHVLMRFRNGGSDIDLRKLSAHWAAYKARHRLDPRIGWATGVLYRELQRAKWTLVRQ